MKEIRQLKISIMRIINDKQYKEKTRLLAEEALRSTKWIEQWLCDDQDLQEKTS